MSDYNKKLLDYCFKQYPTNGHFIFNQGKNLKKVCNAPKNKRGIYLIFALKNNIKELVYIGLSGTMYNMGNFSKQKLYGRLTNKQDGLKRDKYYQLKIEEEALEEIEIFWFVTFENELKILPVFAESELFQRYFTAFGKLPKWNKKA